MKSHICEVDTVIFARMIEKRTLLIVGRVMEAIIRKYFIRVGENSDEKWIAEQQTAISDEKMWEAFKSAIGDPTKSVDTQSTLFSYSDDIFLQATMRCMLHRTLNI